MIFETYHIPNVNESNNKFYFGKDDVEITISQGYEVQDINEFFKCVIIRKRRAATRFDVMRDDNSNNNTDDDDGWRILDNAPQKLQHDEIRD